MFYLVPAGKPIDHCVKVTESFIDARFFVNFMKKGLDEEYDIVEMRRYPFDHVNEHNVLHYGEPEEKVVDDSLYM